MYWRRMLSILQHPNLRGNRFMHQSLRWELARVPESCYTGKMYSEPAAVQPQEAACL